MKNLIILLFFVSFAAQAQVQVTDSVYVENGINKARFTGTVYQIVDEPLYDSYDEYFWVDVATVNQTLNRYHSGALRISWLANIGINPEGDSWSLWWSENTVQEDQQMRINGAHARMSEFAYNSDDFIIVSFPEILDAIESDQLIEFWRLGTLRYERTYSGEIVIVGSRLFN